MGRKITSLKWPGYCIVPLNYPHHFNFMEQNVISLRMDLLVEIMFPWSFPLLIYPTGHYFCRGLVALTYQNSTTRSTEHVRRCLRRMVCIYDTMMLTYLWKHPPVTCNLHFKRSMDNDIMTEQDKKSNQIFFKKGQKNSRIWRR